MSETHRRPPASSLPVLVMVCLAGCGHLPRYARGIPPPSPHAPRAEMPGRVDVFASSGPPVQWGFKGVRFEAIWQWEVSGIAGERTLHATEPERLCHFSLELDGLLPETPPGLRGRPAGDVRSADVPVPRDDYLRLIEAWTLAGQCGTSERPAGPSIAAREATGRYLAEALASLRHESALRGADAVHDVRCFAMHDRSRLWCEGRALVTGA